LAPSSAAAGAATSSRVSNALAIVRCLDVFRRAQGFRSFALATSLTATKGSLASPELSKGGKESGGAGEKKPGFLFFDLLRFVVDNEAEKVRKRRERKENQLIFLFQKSYSIRLLSPPGARALLASLSTP